MGIRQSAHIPRHRTKDPTVPREGEQRQWRGGQRNRRQYQSRTRITPPSTTTSSSDPDGLAEVDEETEWVPTGWNESSRTEEDGWQRVPRRTSFSKGLYSALNVHNQIFRFIDETFPVAQKLQSGKSGHSYRNSNVFVNGAHQGGVGSDYFSECWKEHIPEDSDVLLVDLGINDIRELSSMENYQILLRSLLEMPSQPAVITLQPFSLLFSTLSGASSLHIDVAAYYDTPVICIRDIVLPRILNEQTRKTSTGVGIDVGLEVVKWFRNVPRKTIIVGDVKMVFVDEADAWVDLVHTQIEAMSPSIMNEPRRDSRSRHPGRTKSGASCKAWGNTKSSNQSRRLVGSQ